MKAKDVRKGTVIIYNNAPYRVIDFNHNTPGNLRASVQTKLRNLLNNTQTDVRFSSGEELILADVFIFKATYLYRDGDGCHFMNSENYEEVTIREEVLGDAVCYLQDQMEVGVTTYNGEPIGVELPQTVVLTIAETEPNLRGATASNSPKPAKTDTGLALNVPPFINVGERIIVNTQEGTYIGRAEER